MPDDNKRREAHGVIGDGQQELPLPLAPDSTVPVPMVEDDTVTRTPLPLPPSPASHAAESWLEEAVTRPSALSDIAPSLTGHTLPGGLQSSGSHRVDLDPLTAMRDAHVREMRALKRLMILSSATAAAVGQALGALLLRGCG